MRMSPAGVVSPPGFCRWVWQLSGSSRSEDELLQNWQLLLTMHSATVSVAMAMVRLSVISPHQRHRVKHHAESLARPHKRCKGPHSQRTYGC